MNLHDLVSQLLIDTTGQPDGGLFHFTWDSSLRAFLPEITICGAIVLILLIRLPAWGRRINSAWIASLGSLLALFFAAPWQLLTNSAACERMEIFTGMLVFDGFSVFVRSLLLGFLVLFIVFTSLSGVPEKEDGPDIYVLLLGATLGFCLMASANHLLMVFMAIEMASVPSYALAGMVKRERLGSEAALKYAVYGAGAAGIMLYGISLLAGLVNAVHLPTVASNLSHLLPTMNSPQLMVLALAILMITVGLAFKLSAVPFHFWCPDVFEGTTAEMGGFLSVASKGAALALLLRVVVGIGWIAPDGFQPGDRSAAESSLATLSVQPADPQAYGLFAVSDSVPTSARQSDATDTGTTSVSAVGKEDANLIQIRFYLSRLIALLAIVTCTFGNLAAFGQTNIKRLLAYSTIAHAGYMMMAVPPTLELLASSTHDAQAAAASLVIYISVYLFLNLGAFVVVAFLRNRMGSEQIEDYAGLLRHSPGITICFSLILLGLVGLPPLSGFLGKFAVFAALTDAFRATGAAYLMVLLVAGGLNTAISLFYYLRVVKVMTMVPEAESCASVKLPVLSPSGLYIVLLTIPTALLIVGWQWLNALALAATASLFTSSM